MRRTNIYLLERQTKLLDRRAARAGISRAELIRQLLDRALSEDVEDTATALEAIDSTFGACTHDVEDVERREDDRSHHLERLWRA